MLSEESRAKCADPYFAIGYAKGSIEIALDYLALGSPDNMRDWLRKAYEALDSVEHGYVKPVF